MVDKTALEIGGMPCRREYGIIIGETNQLIGKTNNLLKAKGIRVSQSGMQAIISSSRLEVLKAFYQNPNQELHVREVERRVSLSYERVYAYLKEFEKSGILTARKKGNMRLYKANLGNEITLKLFENIELQRRNAFLRKNPGVASQIRAFLGDALKQVEDRTLMVILFGSVARGKFGKESDMDFLFVTPNILLEEAKSVERDLVRLSSEYSSAYGREIVPLIVNLEGFRKGMQSKRGFFQEIWTDRIILYGESRFFREIEIGGVPSE